jgi:undecaprenyl-diphosphatase
VSALRAAFEREVWRRLLSADQALLLTVRRLESALMTRLMRAFTHLGDWASWVVIGLLLGAAGGAGPRYCALLGIGASVATVTSQVLKRLCCRPRPSSGIRGFAALADLPDAFSFPSGHTAAAFGVAVALAAEGSGLAALTLVLACGIALSRVYLGAHYPLDVAAGILVGALAGVISRLLVDGAPVVRLLGYTVVSLVPHY